MRKIKSPSDYDSIDSKTQKLIDLQQHVTAELLT